MEHFIVNIAIIGVFILIYGLVSEWTERSLITQPMIFVALGVVLSNAVLGVAQLDPSSEVVQIVAELTLILVLFNDGIRLHPQELRTNWLLPIRALTIGMALTTVFVAIPAMLLLDMPFPQALLLGAILAPTDPVLVTTIVKSRRVPLRVRQALTTESGLNDGLALPVVLLFMALAGEEGVAAGHWLEFVLRQVVLGPLVGIVVGYLSIRLTDWGRKRGLIRRDIEALYVIGVALVAYAGAEAVHGNGFLAAFLAGVTIAVSDVELCDCFLEYGEATVQMLMLFTFLIFGSSLVWSGLASVSWPTILFVAVVLFLSRPAAIFVAMIRARLSLFGRGFMAWFGPAGVATILFSILPIVNGVEGAESIFAVSMLVVLASIVLHGFTAMPAAAWYGRLRQQRPMEEEEDGQIWVPLPEQAQAAASANALVTDRSDKGLPLGAAAPHFSLPANDGRQVSLSDFSDQYLVLCFFRGHW